MKTGEVAAPAVNPELRRQMDGLQPGDHICLIYETVEEQLGAVVPFMLRGLERGDRCLYIVDDRTAEEVTAALRGAGVAVTAALESGDLEIVTKRESYLRDGHFDPDAMLLFLGEVVERAVDAGHPALRGTGEMTWALAGDEGTDRLVEYEARLNDFTEEREAILVCQYNRRRFPASTIRDVLRTHPIAVLGDEVCPNPFYEEPRAVLEGATADQDVDRMVRWMRIERARERAVTEDLEERVRERTTELEEANRELEAFAYSVSHDLRAPLRALDGFTEALLEDHHAELSDTAEDYLGRIGAATGRMKALIDGILELSRLMRTPVHPELVDLSGLAHEIVEELRAGETGRRVQLEIQAGLRARGDRRLLRSVLQNLLDNAWKFTARQPEAHIAFGSRREYGREVFFVRDDGAGFDPLYADKLFAPFQRLHRTDEFRGTGVGLASAQRVIRRHGGRIWAEGEEGEGATFYFTLHEPSREKP